MVVYTLNQKPNVYPWATAEEVAGSLSYNNGYVLSGDTEIELAKTNVWAILIDNATMKVVWSTENLPETIFRVA